MAERLDPRARGDRHARPEHHVWLHHHIGLDGGVKGHEHGLRRDQGDPRLHQRHPAPGLEDALGLGEVGLRIAADQVVLAGGDQRAAPAFGPGQTHQVGQVILALCIGVCNFLQEPEHILGATRHHA